MTEAEAVQLAGATARGLNWPWDPGSVVARRRRVWPLPATWRVVSLVAREHAVVTVLVNEQRAEAHPVQIQYAARRELAPPRPGDRRRHTRAIAMLLVGTAVVFGLARLGLGWPLWIALPLGAIWGWLSVLILLSARRPPPGGHDPGT